MKTFVLITLLLLLSTLVQCGLFSSTNIYISSNPVILYSNGSEINFINEYTQPKDFKSGIVPFDNLTQPSSSGLDGILYDRGYSCQVNVSNTIAAPSVSAGTRKIALVKKGGGCNFYQKVYSSELDGAVGVIIYDDIPFQDDSTSGSMKIAKGNLTITMYYVDLNIGVELYNMLQYTSSQSINSSTTAVDNSTTYYQPAISLVMHPSVGGFPSAWEFTLIIIVALLAISFLASVGMHWHLWRVRRRQRALFESGLLDINSSNMTPQQNKKTIEPSSLSIFPTRIIGDEPNFPILTRVDSNRTERSIKALENVQENLNNNKRSSSSSEKVVTAEELAITTELDTSPSTSNNQFTNTEDACVICLDEFALGEQVRKLPCGHEYHCECIDPWLTIKSASCPLCKYDCLLNIPKSEVEEESPDEATELQHPPSYPSNALFSSLNSLRSSNNNSPASSFGPTIASNQVEEFSRSWMARTLPRSMRYQIQAAAAAAAANRESVIELPARMTNNNTPVNINNATIPIVAPAMQQQQQLQQEEEDSYVNNSTTIMMTEEENNNALSPTRKSPIYQRFKRVLLPKVFNNQQQQQSSSSTDNAHY